MHVSNQKCQVFTYLDVNHKNQPRYADARLEGCSIVTFRLETMPTPVRADTSASQGRSTMQRAMIRILLLPNTHANFGAKVIVNAQPSLTYKIVEMQPRYDAAGKLDHFQCDLERL